MKCSGPLSPASVRSISRRRALIGLAALSAAPALAGKPLTAIPQPEAVPQAPDAEKETEIIAAALRYLKLSRTQLMSVLDTGRGIRRRLSMISQAQVRAQQDAETFARSNPSEAQRRITASGAERTQAEAELWLHGAGRLTRILSRLQIGLAWKLGAGRPPQWTKFDPILLEQGGFGGARTEIFLLNDFDGPIQGSRLQAAQPESGAIFDLTIRDTLESPALPAILGLPGALSRSTELGQRFLIQGSGGDGRPFPQRLAEVPDPTVLAPEIQPCAQRLFSSDRLVDVAESMLSGRLDPPSTKRPALPSGNPRLTREYKMEQGLDDQSRHGPQLEPLGGELANGAYSFPAGKGLHAPDLGVTDHYALQFVFRWVSGSSYQKLIDFKDRAVDGGLYTYQNQFTFYTLATGGAPIEGDQRLLIQRNRQTRLVQVFVDFRPAFAFVDLDDDAVFNEKKGWFFIDDKSTNNEQGPGAMRWLTISTGPLSR